MKKAGNLNLNFEILTSTLRQMTKIWYHMMRLYEMITRSVCEIMTKKYKSWHFSMPPISQEKSHMAPIFGSVGSLDQGLLLHKATGR
jgi:hypothetical protein